MVIASNTIEGRALALAERIETLQIQIEREQEECREVCKPMREDIAEIWKECKDGEIPMKPFRAYVKVRTAQRKALSKLDNYERDAYKNLRDSLGPLGAAAAERAGYPAATEDKDLRPDFLKGRAAERADAEALEKVGRGKQEDAVDSLAAKH